MVASATADATATTTGAVVADSRIFPETLVATFEATTTGGAAAADLADLSLSAAGGLWEVLTFFRFFSMARIYLSTKDGDRDNHKDLPTDTAFFTLSTISWCSVKNSGSSRRCFLPAKGSVELDGFLGSMPNLRSNASSLASLASFSACLRRGSLSMYSASLSNQWSVG